MAHLATPKKKDGEKSVQRRKPKKAKSPEGPSFSLFAEWPVGGRYGQLLITIGACYPFDSCQPVAPTRKTVREFLRALEDAASQWPEWHEGLNLEAPLRFDLHGASRFKPFLPEKIFVKSSRGRERLAVMISPTHRARARRGDHAREQINQRNPSAAA